MIKALQEWEKCLAVIAAGMDALQRGDYATAEKAFVATLLLARPLPPDQARDIRSLMLCNMSLLRSRQGRSDEAQKIHEQAMAQLNDTVASARDGLFVYMMVGALMDLGEFRQAIPFCEQWIQSEMEQNEPSAAAEILRRAGTCYLRTGLRDHAAVILRQALKIFRTMAGDPRLPDILMNMGHALRKSSPTEAEQYYQQAAEWHAARGQVESATPAWVNLGIVCSEQGRHAESLAYYEKALRVRERSPAIPPERLGTLLNNIANCYRRMGKFADALRSVDRAIALLAPAGGSALASAYGTRGLIFRDDGQDANAVEWLRKAELEHQRQRSPNLETVAEDLENQVAALRRLGRGEEAQTAEVRLASIRAAMTAVPKLGHDLSKLKATTESAVLVELAFGSRAGKRYGRKEIVGLADRLSEVVGTAAAGWYGGDAVIPESTTLMFYGPDGELLFRSMEPILLKEPMCEGARVTIRNVGKHREVFLPGPVM